MCFVNYNIQKGNFQNEETKNLKRTPDSSQELKAESPDD